jgi:hypothetical protein
LLPDFFSPSPNMFYDWIFLLLASSSPPPLGSAASGVCFWCVGFRALKAPCSGSTTALLWLASARLSAGPGSTTWPLDKGQSGS